MDAENRVDCERIDAELDRRFGGAAAELTAEARSHLEACSRCRGLYRWMLEVPDGGVTPELNRRIEARLLASLGPVKPLPGPGIYLGGFLAAFTALACAITAAMGIAGLHLMSLVQLGSITVTLAIGAILCSFLLTKQVAPAMTQWIPTPLAAFVFAVAALSLTALLFPWRTPDTAITLSWQCLIRVLVIAGVASLLAWLSLRHAAVLSGTAKGAAIGATGGLLGVAVLQYACMYQETLHLLLWHWSGMAIATGVGALAGRLSDRTSET